MTSFQELCKHLNYKLISGGIIESSSGIPFERVGYVIPEEEKQFQAGTHDPYVEEPELLKSTVVKALLSLIEQRQKNTESLDQSAAALFTMQNELKRLTSKLHTDESDTKKMRAKLSELQHMLKQAQAERDSTSKENRQLKTELAKSKSQTLQLKEKMMHEIRRRDQETLKLKNRLYDPRKAKLVPGMITDNPNWKTSITPSNILPETVKIEPVANQAIQQDLDECYARCQQAVDENTQLWDLLLSVSDRLVTLRQLLVKIPNITYSEELDDEYYSLLSFSQSCPSFSEECRSIMEDQLNGFENLIRTSSCFPAEELKLRDSEIKKLKIQLSTMTSNWKQAISTMQMWSNYNSEKSAQNATNDYHSGHEEQGEIRNQMSETTSRDVSVNIDDDDNKGFEDENCVQIGLDISPLKNRDASIDGQNPVPLQDVNLNECQEKVPVLYTSKGEEGDTPTDEEEEDVIDDSLLDAENLSPVKLPVGHGTKRRMKASRIPTLKRIRLQISKELNTTS